MDSHIITSYNESDPLSPAGKPELVFGIVAPAGAQRDTVYQELSSKLEEYGYKSHRIRVSDLIKEHSLWDDNTSQDEASRIHLLMDLGNKIRERSELADAMAIMAIAKIVSIRKESGNYYGYAKGANAYIIDSLKNPTEISALRAIYGSGFVLISAYSDHEQRIVHLSSRIANSRFKPGDKHKTRSDAEAIISRDDQEEGNEFGQNVQNCFPKADFFLNLDQPHKEIKDSLERYLKVIFNHPFITPTRDECGMFHAEANSWRSADLSRQVGAAICTKEGEVLALGCNEVPKAHGGLYWDGDENDGRDFQKGKDKGAEHKRIMVAEIIRKIMSSDDFDGAQKARLNELIKKTITGSDDKVLHGLQALNVIEYGRTVHAEMAALTDAAKRGVSVKGAVIYVNTFPCHLCARHIISSGISRVVYIEPYPKSLTADLFDDSISVGKETQNPKKISFEPFTGIAPRQYQFAFQSTRKRKNKGGIVTEWTKIEATTKLKRYVTSYLAIELGIVSNLLPKVMEADDG